SRGSGEGSWCWKGEPEAPAVLGGCEVGIQPSYLSAAAAPNADPGEKKANPEQFLNLPDVAAVNEKNVSPNHTSRSFNLSPRLLITSPQAKRRSWCRSSLKGTKRRKSLPPVHQDVTELSKSISLELPEVDRLSMLLLSSFQFSAQKLKRALKQTDSFSPEAFKANVHSVSEDLKRYIQKLKQDGTLKSCVEDPKGDSLSGSTCPLLLLCRFAAECQSWDELLLRHQESAEEISRQLEECKRSRGQAEPCSYLQTSQAQVLATKPNYQKILDEQGEVLSCMELVFDDLQQAVKLLQAFTEDSQQYLRHLSEQLATRTFQQLVNSPVRKLIAAPPLRKMMPPPPEG
uniref:DSN1 component of MIS12 kinetochore complex n=1 Tax=Buteo japonicus TaxID=224669 RepID=A0A8C0C0Z1_9AVES